MAGDEAVIHALRAITEDTVLVCCWKPGPRHGDVVRAAAAWLRRLNSPQGPIQRPAL